MALARLQHPRIASFYQAGRSADRARLAMEYVPGQSLAAVLATGPLEAAVVRRLAADLLWALGHAHAAGVLHRDIRPANIMRREDGGFCLLDFGIARLADTGALAAAPLTEAGTIMGSAGYMAPEVLHGEPASVASDLFAVAAVLFEALSGKVVFGGASVAERIHNTVRGGPLPALPQLPESVRAVLGAALDADPTRRPRSAADMLFALEQAWVAKAEQRLPDSLAVLAPRFDGLGPDLTWLGAALRNAIRQGLAVGQALELVPDQRISDWQAASSGAQSPSQLGQRLGCRFVLASVIVPAGGGVAIALSLHDAVLGRLAAQRSLRAPLDQLFSVQSELLQWLGEALGDELGKPLGRALSLPGAHPDADLAECQARAEAAFDRGGKDGLTEAERWYRALLERHPESTAGLAGLASVLCMRYTFRVDGGLLDQAAELCESALAADPAAIEPAVWLVYARMRQGRAGEAVALASRMAVDRGEHPLLRYFQACCLAELEDFGAALKSFQRAIRRDPNRGWSWMGAAWCHFQLGALDAALWCMRRCVDLEVAGVAFPTAGAGAHLCEMLRVAGQPDQAREAGREALARLERSDFIYRDSFRALALINLARLEAGCERRSVAQQLLKEADAVIRGRPEGLGSGYLLVMQQALAALVLDDGRRLAEARALLTTQPPDWRFEWAFGLSVSDCQAEIQRCRDQLLRESAG